MHQILFYVPALPPMNIPSVYICLYQGPHVIVVLYPPFFRLTHIVTYAESQLFLRLTSMPFWVCTSCLYASFQQQAYGLLPPFTIVKNVL